MNENNNLHEEKEEESLEEINRCPICGEELIIVAHCKTCYSCGFGTCEL